MKKESFIMYIFLSIIFLFFICYPLNYLLINKGVINPSFSNFYSIVENDGNIISKLNTKFINLKNNINTKLSNYLFLYSEVNQIVPNIKNINFYKEFTPLGTNSDGEYIFKNNYNNYYILQTNQSDSYIESKMNKSIEFWNELSKESELYIYLPSRYEFREFNDTYNIHNMYKYKELFINSLNKNIIIEELSIKNETEYNQLFYKTDHHWNSYGALNGYKDIIEMFDLYANDYNVVQSDTKYHGSITKKVADNKTYDYFMFIDTKNLKYDVIVENESAPQNFKPMIIKESKNTYYDYYVGYYNGLYSEVIYDYDNETKENLLIIGDSYSWQIDHIIASHFNKTFVLNPKYMEEINLKEYLKENNITKTLVLMETQTTIFDNYEYLYQEKLGGN